MKAWPMVMAFYVFESQDMRYSAQERANFHGTFHVVQRPTSYPCNAIFRLFVCLSHDRTSRTPRPWLQLEDEFSLRITIVENRGIVGWYPIHDRTSCEPQS
jgi:hypothetical protein